MLVPAGISFKGVAWPAATIALIVVNVLAYAAQSLLPSGLVYQLALRPDHVDPVAWLTSMFVHADAEHLASNMVFLWPFGLYLESRLGWWRTLVLYLVSGLGANATFYVIHYREPSAAAGASGAIAGLMGLCVVAAPLGRLRVLPVNPAVIALAYVQDRRFTVYMPLIAWVMLWLLVQGIHAHVGVQGIAFAAHFGGIGAGIALGVWMRASSQLTGPATEEEQRELKRQRLLVMIAQGWQQQTSRRKPVVDYMQSRQPNFGPSGAPHIPIAPHQLGDPDEEV